MIPCAPPAGWGGAHTRRACSSARRRDRFEKSENQMCTRQMREWNLLVFKERRKFVWLWIVSNQSLLESRITSILELLYCVVQYTCTSATLILYSIKYSIYKRQVSSLCAVQWVWIWISCTEKRWWMEGADGSRWTTAGNESSDVRPPDTAAAASRCTWSAHVNILLENLLSYTDIQVLYS